VEPKPVQVALKRAFDIVLSAVAIWLLSPILVATAIAIQALVEGAGPLQAAARRHAQPPLQHAQVPLDGP